MDARATSDHIVHLRALSHELGLHGARGLETTRLGKPLDAILADRLKRAEAAVGALHERPVDERVERTDREPERVQEVGCCSRRKARREHGERAQRLLLVLLEQVPAPVDERPQRLVPRQGRTRSRAEQGEPVVEARRKFVDGHGAQPRRGELDREGQPVEALAHDCGEFPLALIETRASRGNRAALEELEGRLITERADGDEGLPHDT